MPAGHQGVERGDGWRAASSPGGTRPRAPPPQHAGPDRRRPSASPSMSQRGQPAAVRVRRSSRHPGSGLPARAMSSSASASAAAGPRRAGQRLRRPPGRAPSSRAGQRLVPDPGPGIGGVGGCAGRPRAAGRCASTPPAAWPAARRAAAAGSGRGGRASPPATRAPEPRASPSSTVSAWSSRLWPSSTAAAPVCRATSSSAGVPGAARRGLRAARAGPGGDGHPARPPPGRARGRPRPPRPGGPVRLIRAAARGRRSRRPPAAPAGAPRGPAPPPAPANPRRPSRRPAPGHRRSRSPSQRRTQALRTSATAGCGPMAGQPPRPCAPRARPAPATGPGAAISSLVGRVSGEVHTLLKVAIPASSTTALPRTASPGRTASSSGRCPASGGGSARSARRCPRRSLKRGPDLLDRGHHLRPDGVHHVVAVALDQCHHAGQAVQDLPLAGGLDGLDEAVAAAAPHRARPWRRRRSAAGPEWSPGRGRRRAGTRVICSCT